MKNLLSRALFVMALPILGQTASAVVLFSDNYDANSNQTPNDQIGNAGRQAGTLATLGYLQIGNVQIGNTATLPPSPGNSAGDEFLAAFGGRAAVNHDFSTETSPITVTFIGLVSSLGGGTPDDWVSFTVGSSAGPPFVNDANAASILFRANGATELWNHGANAPGASGTAPGFDVWWNYKIVLSDTAGTGSAFAGNGSRADYYSNGVLLGTQTISQLNPGQGFFGFSANHIVGYDNLSISVVPEPTGIALLSAGLGLMALRRKRRA